VDLKDVTLDKTRGVLYMGHPAVYSRQIGKGSFGSVSLLTFRQTKETVAPAIIVKKQAATDEVLANLKVAESLRDCGLVDFKSASYKSASYIWTFMEHMSGDCRTMPLSRRKVHAAAFAQFLDDTLNCLLGLGASFGDMKLLNCAFRQCASGPEFRLIDVDGVNSDYASFPAFSDWESNCTDPADQAAQTRYAFGVTALLFEQNNDAYKPFYWQAASREALLLAHADRTPTPKIRSLIMDHAIPVLRMRDPRVDDADTYQQRLNDKRQWKVVNDEDCRLCIIDLVETDKVDALMAMKDMVLINESDASEIGLWRGGLEEVTALVGGVLHFIVDGPSMSIATSERFEVEPVVKALLARGLDVNQRTLTGDTPLHTLIRGLPPYFRYDENLPSLNRLITTLVDAGTDLTAVNDAGKTPIEIALDNLATLVRPNSWGRSMVDDLLNKGVRESQIGKPAIIVIAAIMAEPQAPQGRIEVPTTQRMPAWWSSALND
jgi:hypothetical protein